MKSFARFGSALAAAVLAVTLVTGAAGSPADGSKAIRAHGDVVVLALNGSRAAFGNGPRIVVWNLQTGKTTKLSTLEDAHLLQLAIAGSQVTWYMSSGGNLESDDYLLGSSLANPKPHVVATTVRSGAPCGAGRSGNHSACAGTWFGGVVASGNRILVNRWRTDTSGTITGGGLYALEGSKFRPVAGGAHSVQAVAADSQHVAVLQWRWLGPAKTMRVYSSHGTLLWSAKPKVWPPLGVAVSGRNLVVLEINGTLAVYDVRTGVLRRTFNLHAKELSKDKRPYGNPRWLQALAVQGNIAVYSKPVRFNPLGNPRVSALHALNLSSGKDRVVGRSPGQIVLARMDSVGLVYATSAEGYAPNRVVFAPSPPLPPSSPEPS